MTKKKEDTVRVKDFRHISLTTSVCKLTAKVLTKRLKKVIQASLLLLRVLSWKAGKFWTQFSLQMNAGITFR